MKKITILLASMMFAFILLAGCTNPLDNEGNETTNTTNATTVNGSTELAEQSVIIFYDPAFPAEVNQQIESYLTDLNSELPNLPVKRYCVDITYVTQGTPSESEELCIQEVGEKEYTEGLSLIKDKEIASLIALKDNENYHSLMLPPIKEAFVSNICDKLENYDGCDDVESLPKTESILIKKQELPENFDLFIESIEGSGLPMDLEYLDYPSDEAQEYINEAELTHLPVMLINGENLNENQVAFLTQSFEKVGDNYIYKIYEETSLGITPTFIGETLKLEGTAYLSESSENETVNAIITSLNESLGVELDLAIEVVDNTTNREKMKTSPTILMPLNQTNTEKIGQFKNRVEDKGLVTDEVDGYLRTYLTSGTNYIGPTVNNVTMDLYVMSECPYGLQMQKAAIPVAQLFENESSVDINNKFVNYVMHGEPEKEYNIIQYCVDQETDQIWDYLECFVEEEGKSETCLDELGIDQEVVNECVETTKETYDFTGTAFPIFTEENEKYGITGSPGVVLNGVKTNMARNAEDIKDEICSYLSEKPAACDVDLTEYGSPGASYGPVKPTDDGSTSTATCG